MLQLFVIPFILLERFLTLKVIWQLESMKTIMDIVIKIVFQMYSYL